MDGLNQLRSVEEIASKRGISVREVFGLPQNQAKPVEEAPAVESAPADEAKPAETADKEQSND
jgi:hypothetical protein